MGVYLSKETREKLDAFAKARKLSCSGAAAHLIERGLLTVTEPGTGVGMQCCGRSFIGFCMANATCAVYPPGSEGEK